MTGKMAEQLHGCETRIRQACDTTMTQRDWCEIWERAKSDALKGKTALLLCLLPIVARKMPSEDQPVIAQMPVVTEAERRELEGYGNQANA